MTSKTKSVFKGAGHDNGPDPADWKIDPDTGKHFTVAEALEARN